MVCRCTFVAPFCTTSHPNVPRRFNGPTTPTAITHPPASPIPAITPFTKSLQPITRANEKCPACCQLPLPKLPPPLMATSKNHNPQSYTPFPATYLYIGLCTPRPSLPRHPALLLHTPAQTLTTAGVCLACTVTWQRATGLANRLQGFVHLCRGLWVVRMDYRCYLCARKAWDVDEEPMVGGHASAGGTGRAYKCG
jgi:hypothetical protein